MVRDLRQDADYIVHQAIRSSLPDEAVRRAMGDMALTGAVYLLAAGKAAWRMADVAARILGDRLTRGMVITKYGHAEGDIPRVECREAGHPVPDANSFQATRAALDMLTGLKSGDTVLFLLSGGGSALFELPLIPPDELQDVTRQLLACGADIVETNAVRKRLSAVKGGKFALHCMPAHIEQVVLSDIIGDPLDMIASGPAYPDASTADMAVSVAEKYRLNLSDRAKALIRMPLPESLPNVHTQITGSVRLLCQAACKAAAEMGYEPTLLTDRLACQAREAGRFLGAVAASNASSPVRRAFIAGGETVVTLTGNGLGGRNQEIALAAAPGLNGLANAAVFSVGSDGTDGPTDAAGGYADGGTLAALEAAGIRVDETLRENDSYHALKAVGGLIVTGPTGTNVNDVSVVLAGG